MTKSDKSFYAAMVAIVIAVLIPVGFVAMKADANADFSQWSKGYCAAIGGESITDEVCNVDGKVVTIPREEFGR
jgi:hypothetical protein